MSTRGHEIRVAGLPVQVVRKPIKNLHLGVYPPNGRVRVAAPIRVSDQAVRLAVIGKLGWINVSSTSSSTSCVICSSGITPSGSPRSWTNACHAGGCIARS